MSIALMVVEKQAADDYSISEINAFKAKDQNSGQEEGEGR